MIKFVVNSRVGIVFFLSFLIFLDCKNHKVEDLNDCFKLNFKKPFLDTISKYCNEIDSSCNIIFNLNVDIIRKIYRINIYTPNDSTIFKSKFKFWTQIDKRKIFIISNLEEFLEPSNAIEGLRINTNCELNLFVVYDSANIITVIKDLNDYNSDLSPQKKRAFIPK